MCRTLPCLVVLLLLASLSGCVEDRRIAAVRKALVCANEAADIMAQIKDEATARAWAPKLTRVYKRLKELEEEYKKIPGQPDEDEIEQLKDMFDKDMEAAARRERAERLRLHELMRNNETIKQLIEPAFQGKNMDQAGPDIKFDGGGGQMPNMPQGGPMGGPMGPR
jgi:hypothetical protein